MCPTGGWGGLVWVDRSVDKSWWAEHVGSAGYCLVLGNGGTSCWCQILTDVRCLGVCTIHLMLAGAGAGARCLLLPLHRHKHKHKHKQSTSKAQAEAQAEQRHRHGLHTFKRHTCPPPSPRLSWRFVYTGEETLHWGKKMCSGTCSLALLAWHRLPGTWSLALEAWHRLPGTSSLALVAWH